MRARRRDLVNRLRSKPRQHGDLVVNDGEDLDAPHRRERLRPGRHLPLNRDRQPLCPVTKHRPGERIRPALVKERRDTRHPARRPTEQRPQRLMRLGVLTARRIDEHTVEPPRGLSASVPTSPSTIAWTCASALTSSS